MRWIRNISVSKMFQKSSRKKSDKSILKSNSKNSTSRPNRTDIAYCVYYQKETKSLQLKNSFPSVKGWEEIGKIYEKNSKNIQQLYNSICNNELERLQKSRIKTIEFIIENMLSKYPEALKLAKDELNLANLKS